MRPDDFERYRKIIRDWERIRPSIEQLKSVHRQTEPVRKMFADPKVRQAYVDAAKIFDQRNRLVDQLPDAATRQALSQAVWYLNSPAFQNQRNALLRTIELTQQRLGPTGVAAAQRIATRRAAADGNLEQAANRIEAGQVAELLEQATELAGSPGVRETIEQADPEILVQLDEEQQDQGGLSEPGVWTEFETGESSAYLIEYPEFTKEELLEMHRDALLILYILEAALAWLTVNNLGAPLYTTLLVVVSGLIAFVLVSQAVISSWDD